MINNLKILYHQGKQYIPDVTTAKVPGIFRGRPIISCEKVDEEKFIEVCPMQAISKNPIAIDLGKCNFAVSAPCNFPKKFLLQKIIN